MSRFWKHSASSGFTLVELIVVIGVVGVMTSIATSQFNLMKIKARQSEAKANLSAYYQAQSAFFAEWSSYHPRVEAIGFILEGYLWYNVGVSNANVALAPSAEPGFPTYNWVADHANFNSPFCADAGQPIRPPQKCGYNSRQVGGGGPRTPNMFVDTYSNLSNTSYRALANGYIDNSSGAIDQWGINNLKQITCVYCPQN